MDTSSKYQKRIMISAMESSSGKTTVSAALLKLFSEEGYRVSGIKCGPDYIDPMFHKFVTKDTSIGAKNADLFLQGEDRVRELIALEATKDLLIFEGAMGYYDGIGGTLENSAYDIADRLDIPVLLILKPKGISTTLAALLKGMTDFVEDSHIKAVILNDCSRSLFLHLKPIIEERTGLELLGYIPKIKEARLLSRHLGLKLAGENKDLDKKLDLIVSELKETVNTERLLELSKAVEKSSCSIKIKRSKEAVKRPKIAIACDSAFCFYYETSLRALEAAGAELLYFSPLSHERLPKDISGLYIGGGYPELHLKELSSNMSMMEDIREAIRQGLPTIAECGGFIYLHDRVLDLNNKNTYDMVGIIRGKASYTGKLVSFGYIDLENTSGTDNMLFKKGEKIAAHEFHYYDSENNGEDLLATKPVGKRSYKNAYISPSLYAGYPHLDLGGKYPLAERFVKRAVEYGIEHGKSL
ncbi:MAG: cobyrinate a,c-diamide synthase [Lachnospiraceae bacterium]|nr:cobyrinate a,c-diamide synthase [Lachnospiraceae bacterium]